MARKGALSLAWKKLARRMKFAEIQLASHGGLGPADGIGVGGTVSKVVKKKAAGSRLWMRIDRSGKTEIIECDKNAIIQRAGIPPRDLRILGPVFSHSSNIVGEDFVQLWR